MIDYRTLISTCDQEIKAGAAVTARRRLRDLEYSRVPRVWRLPLARICRRAGTVSSGLRLLSAVVYPPSGDQSPPPSHQEKAEYAVLLLRSGCHVEAMKILDNVDPAQAHEALVNKAYIHFAHWEYAEAVPLLEDYLSRANDPHSELVAKTNLAFALVETRNFGDAWKILKPVQEIESVQMRSTWRGLRAQIQMMSGDFAGAREELVFAQSLVQSIGTNDQFFVQKLSLILNGLETRDQKWFAMLRQAATQNRSWESVRESDYYALKLQFCERRFADLYFGTPFESFRNLLKAEFNHVPPEPEYVLGTESAPCLDLKTGAIEGTPQIKPGSTTHRLLHTLLGDLYRPLRAPGVFSVMFAGEYFDVATSPHRVHQIISRARQELLQLGLPLTIDEKKGFYTVAIGRDLSIRIPPVRVPDVGPRLQLQSFYEAFSQTPRFSAEEVAAKLGLSRATTHRLLHRALEDAGLEALGRTRRVDWYRLRQAA